MRPGESNLSALADEWQALDGERACLLRELGVASLAEASARHERWQQLENDRANHARA